MYFLSEVFLRIELSAWIVSIDSSSCFYRFLKNDVVLFPKPTVTSLCKVIDDDDVDDDNEGKVDDEESIAAIGIDTGESIWLLICEMLKTNSNLVR